MIRTPQNPRSPLRNPICRIAALALLIGSAPLNAQRPQPHWPDRAVVTVWIDQRGLPPGDDELVERAMRTWTKASDGRLTLQRTLVAADAGIRVFFNDAGGNYGETRPRVDPATGLIDHADVAILADVPVTDAMTKQIIAYLTALHELGHAIGLAHTTNFSDIMYLFRYPDDGPRYFGNYRARLKTAADIGSATATGLSQYDVAALRALYAGK